MAGVALQGPYVKGLGSSLHVICWGKNIQGGFCTLISCARARVARISEAGQEFSVSINGSLRVVSLGSCLPTSANILRERTYESF